MANKVKQLRILMILAAVLCVWGGVAAPAWAVTDADFVGSNWEQEEREGKAVEVAEPGLGAMMGRLALSLGVVFGLIALVGWLARRYLPKSAGLGRGGVIELVGSRSLGPRKSLVLVRTQGRTILLGVTGTTINTLSEFDEAGDLTWQDAAMATGLDGLAPERERAATTSLEAMQ